MGCSRVLLLGFRVLLGAFCRLALVVLVYLGAPLLLIKKKKNGIVIIRNKKYTREAHN
jgi:hypothetical protein